MMHRLAIRRRLGALGISALLFSPLSAWADSSLFPTDPGASAAPVVATDSPDFGSANTNADGGMASDPFRLPSDDQSTSANQPGNSSSSFPDYFDDQSGSEKPNIHGFAGAKMLTDYITPRGLVVVDEGVVTQPIVGLVFPIGDLGPLKGFTFIAGLWNCIASHQADPHVGPWNEMDDFFAISASPLKNLNLTLTYVAFNSPNGIFVTEHNMDLLIAYDDSPLWGGNFGLHPNLDCWWAISGDSTVVAGRRGGTGYFQPGITPTYTLKLIKDYPITLTFPTYISVGPTDYWSTGSSPTSGTWGGGNVGVFSAGFDAAVNVA